MSFTSVPPGPSSVGPARRRSRPVQLPAVLAAVAVLLVVVGGGIVFWQQQPPQYSATTTLVVLPSGNSAEAASYYDTLSRGQIGTTFAQILALRATPDESRIEVTVEVVPETSLIQVTATGDTAEAAEGAADQALGRAQPYFNQLGSPYAVSVVQGAAGTAKHAGLTAAVLSGVVLAVALIAALGAYLAVRGLQHARAQARLVDGHFSGEDGAPASDVAPSSPSAELASSAPANGRAAGDNSKRRPRQTAGTVPPPLAR